MKVYVLQETWPDFIETSVYKDIRDAINALAKLAEEEGMEYYEDIDGWIDDLDLPIEAEGEGIYAIVEEKELN